MGNACCPGQPLKKGSLDTRRSPGHDEPPLTQEEEEEQRLEDMLRQMKEYHKQRIRHELETDPHTFILDNLLMCIQFFDHFEKARDAANQYKNDIEREMTELLGKDPREGMILGDRRVKLLTGMSHILSQKYIYQGKVAEEEEIDSYYGGVHLKDTFMAEGITPLEFTMTWENLEVYDETEKEDLKHYSDPKGASPVARFCMEQPAKNINFPKGFVRLRVIDDPIFLRRKMDTPNYAGSDGGYAGEPVYNKVYSDGPSEAFSESDGASSQSIEDEEDKDMKAFKESLMNASAFSLPGKSKLLNKTQEEPAPSTSAAALAMANNNAGRKPPPIVIPPPNVTSADSPPNLLVHPSTPPLLGAHANRSLENLGLLYPHSIPGRILNTTHSRSTPNLGEARDSPGKETSSGYATTSTRSVVSSHGSERVRDKWQKLNLKRLTEFGKKSRHNHIPPGCRYDPLPENCYCEIKFEKNSIDEPIEEDDDGSESSEDELSSTDSDSDSLIDSDSEEKAKPKKNAEEDYEMRFYLNSLQVSSNACSEFQVIAPRISIPDSALAHGVVLGTTIRCPIPYQYPQENEIEDVGSYYVTHSFTPCLHSKSWPKMLDTHFRLQINPMTQDEMDSIQGERWPSREQLERIDKLGCNAIPLGYRSMDFFNAEQILEWELNFHECEANLLDSFRSSHWRAYIFSAILFRAFIAPLGPQGIGLEHIRNILYDMCHENFSLWNDEQSGAHLRILLDKLFKYLSRSQLPSFFVRARNLLQGIPQQNISFVQAHLKQIRDNLIVYMIYAFRNLREVQKTEMSYPLPNFKKLYLILTAPDQDLLQIKNPYLQMQKDREDEEKRAEERRKSRKKSRKKHPHEGILEQDEVIDKEFFTSNKVQVQAPKRDKYYMKVSKHYDRFQKQMQDLEKKKRLKEQEELKNNPEHRLPNMERRQSIDLRKQPTTRGRFTVFRLLLVIQFFIEHFRVMAQKALDMKSYSQATMYVLQVENLSEIVYEDKFQHKLSPFEDDYLEDCRRETLRLRAYLGKDMYQYILSRLMKQAPSTPVRQTSNEPPSPTSTHFPTFTNNWDLRRLPPTPPSPDREVRPLGRRLEKPDIVSSFKSLTVQTSGVSPSPPPVPSSFPSERRVPRRQESIKFVGSGSPSPVPPGLREPTPPATPPRTPIGSKRPPSRQSINLFRDNLSDPEESTDL